MASLVQGLKASMEETDIQLSDDIAKKVAYQDLTANKGLTSPVPTLDETYSVFGGKPQITPGTLENVGNTDSLGAYLMSDADARKLLAANLAADTKVKTEQAAQIQAQREGVLGTGLSGTDWANIGLGAGQLGLGVASFLENKSLGKKQKELMNQQIANNADLMQRRKERSANIAKYFG